MRFGVLGPLSVSLDGGAVSLGGRKQRTLLAVLLLHANAVVPRDVLLDALLPRVKDDADARQEFIDLLETLGPDDERTGRYRKALSTRLF